MKGRLVIIGDDKVLGGDGCAEGLECVDENCLELNDVVVPGDAVAIGVLDDFAAAGGHDKEADRDDGKGC